MGFLFVIGLGILTAAAVVLIGYKAWVMTALAILWISALIYSYFFGHRGFGGGPNTDVQIVLAGAFITAAILTPKYNAQKPCNQDRDAIRKLVAAENEFFAAHKTYTTDMNLLKFKPNPHMYIQLLRGDEQSFAAAVGHLSCDENRDGTPDMLIWDSARGGLQ